MELCIGFASGFATQVGESVVIPMSRQFGYLVHYRRNIIKLRSEVEELENMKDRIQNIVDEDTKNGRKIVVNVEVWLCKVEKTKKEVQEFFKDEVKKNSCLRCCSPNLVSRLSLSKKAKKLTSSVKSLMEEKFEVISYPAPLPIKKPAFLDNIKISIDMRDFKKLPKIKGVGFRIPMFGLTFNFT